MDSNSNVGGNQTSQSTISYDDLVNKEILELMGVKEMSDEEKTQIYREMAETIQMRVLKRVERTLTDDEIDTLTNFVEKNDGDSFNKMLISKNIDLGVLYAEETLAYKAEMVSLVQKKNDKKEE